MTNCSQLTQLGKTSAVWLILLIGILPFTTSCRTTTNNSDLPREEQTMSYQTDVAALNRLIQLPAEPQKAYWQTYDKSDRGSELGPTDWELVAVLEYDVETIQNLQTQLIEQTHPAELFVNPDFVKSWFPPAISDQFVEDARYSQLLKLNSQRYMPTPFTKAPLHTGYLFISDNLIFLFLHTQ